MSKRIKPKVPKIQGTPVPAHLERHVRVTFFLVADKKEHLNAIDSVRDYLRWQYIEEESEKELPVTGFTHSLFPGTPPRLSGETVFVGHWWYTTEKGVARLTVEKTALFLVDFPAYAEEWKTDENIALLKRRILELYCPQKEIWIVKQDVYRYA